MKLLRPLPRCLSRPSRLVVVLAWVAPDGLLLQRHLQASSVSLAADLARYGSSAQWKGVYYRGEKIGFMVGADRAHRTTATSSRRTGGSR